MLGLVGRGGMGEVHAAYDPSLDRRIALKLMRAEASWDDRGQERLLREAQSIAKLSHPNVVVVHDVGTLDGQVFVAMEFVEGVTLAAWVTERERSWREILAIFIQAARGLSAAHEAGFVHRDFKPQNVMVGSDGTARVMDFGLARRIGETSPPASSVPESSVEGPLALTHTGDVLGTPLYMAPEQLAAGQLDARTDQFSFCVALFWALHGVHPFEGRTVAELGANAAAGRFATPTKKHAVPAWIQKVLLRGLRADREARWPSMDDVATALARDPARRRRNVAMALGISLLLLALGAGASRFSHAERATCLDGASRLQGAWELSERAGARRSSVRAAILASGTSEPDKKWERIASLLDRHASRWVEAYREACEATHVRGEQSAETLDLRMECLNDNLESTRALTGLLSRGGREIVDHGVEAAGALEDLTRCRDIEQLRAGVRPPKDPMIRRAVEDQRKRLKEAEALREVGQLTQATEVVAGVVAAQETGAYAPLRAEALLLQGMAIGETVPRQGAIALERALVTAEACGHDRVVAAAAGSLVFVTRTDDPRAAERWAELAAAAITRIGGDARLESWLANNVGALRYKQRRWEDALRETTRSVALKERAFGADHVELAKSLANNASMLQRVGRFAEALDAIDRALAIHRHWLSADSVFLGIALCNRAEILLNLGRLDESRADYGHALEIFQAPGVAANKESLAEALAGLGAVAMSSDHLAEARARYESALEERTAAGSADVDVAETQFRLALVLDRIDHEGDRARDLATKALAVYAAQPGLATEHREVQAWLARRSTRVARPDTKTSPRGPGAIPIVRRQRLPGSRGVDM